MKCTKGRDFNQFLPHHHMHNLEAATDDAGTATATAHLFRRGVGGNVKVFGVAIQQQVADCTAYDVGSITGAFQIFADALGAPAEHIPGNTVGLNTNNCGLLLRCRRKLALKNLFDETVNHSVRPICWKSAAGVLLSRRVITGQP